MRIWLCLALALVPACGTSTTVGTDGGSSMDGAADVDASADADTPGSDTGSVHSCDEAFAAIGGARACAGGPASGLGCTGFDSCVTCSCNVRCVDGVLSVYQFGRDTGCDLDAAHP